MSQTNISKPIKSDSLRGIMRRQCLFDPNHLIDEYGYNKHLLNCQSKLKKDWRMCKYDDTHWLIYHQVQFHQKYDCPMNPLCIQNPKEFHLRRIQEIRRRQQQDILKKNSKMDSVLSELKQELQQDEKELSFSVKPQGESINFGEISMIETNIKSVSQTCQIRQNKTLQNNSILDLHEALNFEESLKTNNTSSIINQSHSINKKPPNLISMKDQEMFEKGIVKNKNLWQEPDFSKFEASFRKRQQQKRQKGYEKKSIRQEEKMEDSFQEEIDDLEISVANISSKYNQIDND